MKKMHKRLTALILAISMLSAMCMMANAAEKNIRVTLDGQVIETAAYGDSHNRAQVPISIGEKLNMSVVTDGGKVTFTKNDKSISFVTGSSKADSIEMDTVAGEGYVPVAYLGQYFGYQVSWDAAARTVVMTSPKESTGLQAVKWTEDNIGINSNIPKNNGIQMLYQGYYQEEITVGAEKRSAKVYIPKGSEQGSYFVVITVPDKMNTEEFLKTSGWMDKADKENFCLFVMEAADGNGNWGTVDEEAGYVQAAYAALVAGKYYLPFPTFYLVGYGTGGTALQKYAMTNAITVAGAAFIDASNIDDSYLTTMASTNYKNTEIAYSEVPVPVWIISTNGDQADSVIEYWKKANECESAAEKFALGSTLYHQKANTGNAFTACGNVGKVAVLTDTTLNVADKDLTDALYDQFLCKTTRYGGNAGGNVLAERPDYEKLGVEFKTMTVDGYKREYLVYVPKAYRNSGEALPVVFSLHGANQTYKMMFDISRWFEIADKEGFILVMPTATLNPGTAGKVATPTWKDNPNDTVREVNDIHFIETLIQQIDQDYSVDSGRRYFSGQSNGSMMTNHIGQVLPEYFAAIGSTSGPIAGEERLAKDAKTSILPGYLLMGEYDFWSWDTTEGFVNMTLNYWLNRNGVGSVEEPTSVKTEGRYTTYEWQNKDGITLYRYTQTAGRGHSFVPEEMQMLWDWFENWSRDAQQGILYNGAPISRDAK